MYELTRAGLMRAAQEWCAAREVRRYAPQDRTRATPAHSVRMLEDHYPGGVAGFMRENGL